MPTSPRRPRTAALAVGLALLTTSLAACGGDDDAADPAPGGSPGQPTTTLTEQGGGGVGEGAGPFAWTGDPDRDGSLNAAKVRLRTVAELESTTDLVPRPGHPAQLWASQREGQVIRLRRDGDRLVPDQRPALDISDDTTTEAERGLLGLAFSTGGDELYVSHTNAEGDTRLDAYRMAGDRVRAGTKRTILAFDQPYPNHNGGDVAIGPDGMLWFGLGDGGAGDDPENRAQDPDEPLGKILRVDPRTPADGKEYSIPAGNPFADGGGRPEIALMGVRNPWRWAFDPETKDLWIGDVGQNAVEEVDHLPEGSILGKNLGWSGFEGSVTYLDGDGRRPARSVPPVFEYRHDDDGGCSITGGFVYRGKAIPALDGAYLFTDYCDGRIRALVLGADGRVRDERALGVTVDQPISFGQDADGELYVLAEDGTISRIEAA